MGLNIGDKVEYVDEKWPEGKYKIGEIVRITTDGRFDNVQVQYGEDLQWATNLVWLPINSLRLARQEEKLTALDEAKKLVYGDRNQDYGNPWDDFERTSKMWSVILGTEVTPEQYALCMITVKISRLLNDPTKRDSWVDIAGYAECYNRLQEWRNENGD